MSAEVSEENFQYRIRRFQCADVPFACRLLRRERALPAALDEALEKTFLRMLRGQFAFGSMVERLRAPGARWEPAGFGLAAFMSDTLAERYFSEPIPFLAVEILEAVRAGRAEEALLHRDEIARRQRLPGSRLAMVVPFWLQDNYDLQGQDAWQLMHLASRSVDRYMRGYRLHSVVLEGQRRRTQLQQAAGFEHLVDMSAAERRSRWRSLCDDPRYQPLQHAVHTRDLHVRVRSGTPVAALFMFREPILDLTDSQKVVLDLALDDFSDEEIASLLGTSTNAVRKRWRGIYEKMEERLGDIFHSTGHREGVRGHEKRRIAVAWVRDHPEEIRPGLFVPPCERE